MSEQKSLLILRPQDVFIVVVCTNGISPPHTHTHSAHTHTHSRSESLRCVSSALLVCVCFGLMQISIRSQLGIKLSIA